MKWLSERAVRQLHKRAIMQYGGLEPIATYDEKLEATLSRPQQLEHYNAEVTLPELAASYGFGLVKNHCFSDGNKRIAFYAVFTFLHINGYTLVAREVDAAQTIENLAAGVQSESEFAGWIADNIKATVETDI